MPTAQEILYHYWRHQRFRPLQEAIIHSIVSGNDTLALLPTGGGKSVCYQIPALMQDGFCLVVTPLIALMQDQIARLKEMEIPAACVHAGMHYMDVKRTLGNMVHGPYKLLYVSPERLQTGLFQDYLPEFNISMIAVDEAHCISQWGHDFRPEYLKIAQLRAQLPDVPVLALTASATPAVQQDIVTQLQLKQPQVYTGNYERTNIYYQVRYSENKTGDVLQQCRKATSSIVYCRSRKQTENLSRQLNQQQIPAVAYHAGMSKDARKEAQEAWMSDTSPIIVATTAFGMGIDKADVGKIVHYDATEHLEAYYQESGRAGRNGAPAQAVLLYNQSDIERLHDSTTLKYPTDAYLRQVYQSVVEYLQIPTGTQPDEYFTFDLQDFSKKFNLEVAPATYALKLLAQEGLWTLSDAVFRPATVQFVTERQTLDGLEAAYPELSMLCTALLRQYNSIFYYPTVVSKTLMAKKLRATQEQVHHMLQQLQHMGVLDYQLPIEGPQMYFHHYRVDSKHLHINWQRINLLKQQHVERVKAMIAYLENTTRCRNGMLLRYFGQEAGDHCGHCDVCQQKNEQGKVTTVNLREELLQYIAQHEGVRLQDLYGQYTAAMKDIIVQHVREMIEDGQVYIDKEYNALKVNK